MHEFEVEAHFGKKDVGLQTARRIERFLSQPFFVAEVFTGLVVNMYL
jgi:F0F1-type ATP synthase beta subunit